MHGACFISPVQICGATSLRAASRVEISADIDEKNDRWIDAHDKTTRADRGRQPVSLCNFARDCISNYRSHCTALARRLKKAFDLVTQQCMLVSHLPESPAAKRIFLERGDTLWF